MITDQLRSRIYRRREGNAIACCSFLASTSSIKQAGLEAVRMADWLQSDSLDWTLRLAACGLFGKAERPVGGMPEFAELAVIKTQLSRGFR